MERIDTILLNKALASAFVAGPGEPKKNENKRLYGTWGYENQWYSGINIQWFFYPDNSWELHMYNTIRLRGSYFEYIGNTWNGGIVAMTIDLSNGDKKMRLINESMGFRLLTGAYIKTAENP
ncbi:MAG: hypothetical protein LBO65_00615 [Spirochaetaceae bacterium]|jgi:hypothetical protein|nr:hypothetical protein [Spirochaetaceae bacterium]